MSYEHTTGHHIIRCDECHRASEQRTSIPAAAGAAPLPLPQGWTTRGAGHICPVCSARRSCAGAGHDFGPWRELAGAPDHLVERVCLGCGVDELAPTYVLAPRHRAAS